MCVYKIIYTSQKTLENQLAADNRFVNSRESTGNAVCMRGQPTHIINVLSYTHKVKHWLILCQKWMCDYDKSTLTSVLSLLSKHPIVGSSGSSLLCSEVGP